ncbi:hypothetical protein BKA93DRAFT_822244 [Sparassis latifolia]
MGCTFVTVPVKTFLSEFVPQPDVQAAASASQAYLHAFDGMPNSFVSQEHFFGRLARCADDCGLWRGYSRELVLSEDLTAGTPVGDPYKVNTHMALFRNEDAHTKESELHWSYEVLSIIYKPDATVDDLFAEEKDPNLPDAEMCATTRAHIQSIASTILSRQHRTSVFTVLFFPTCARLMRWDRHGAIVTEQFPIKVTQDLATFFWRFARLSPEQQGYDPTAKLVLPGSDDHRLMVDISQSMYRQNACARAMFAESLEDPDRPCWKLRVVPEGRVPMARRRRTKRPTCGKRRKAVPQEEKDEENEEAYARYFLVGKPHFEHTDLPGRGTRGYVALDCKTKKLVFLKDSWRFDPPVHQTEGAALKTLKKAKVTNIPTLVCYGDIGDQRTRTLEFVGPENSWPADRERDVSPTLVHSRLVVEEVCLGVHDFHDGKELLQIFTDVIDAHRQAVENAGLMHCDISSGNILIYERLERRGKELETRRSGLLCDWELAAPVRDAENGGKEAPRKPGSMGTWQFMSVLSLDHPRTAIATQDELEAFFHVLLQTALVYIANNFEVPAFIQDFFFTMDPPANSACPFNSCNSLKRKAMHTGVIEHEKRTLEFYDRNGGFHPFGKVFDLLILLFRAHYTTLVYEEDCEQQDMPPQMPLAVPRQGAVHRVGVKLEELNEEDLDARKHLAELLKTHQGMRQLLLTFLDREWPSEDKVEPELPNAESEVDSSEPPSSKEVERKLQLLGALSMKRGREEEDESSDMEEEPPRKVQRANSEEA